MVMNKKEVYAWGMYDLANTVFSALFVTFFFPFFIKQFLGGNEFQIGLTFGLSMLAVGIIVPVIGSWSDHLGRRMPFIMIFTGICCFFTLLVSGAGLVLALVSGFVANFAFHAALTTYNALLPRLAGKSELGRVSGIGIAMGYIGTLFSLGIAALLLSKFGWETRVGVQSMFYLTSLMFIVFSIPLFIFIKEKVSAHSHHVNIHFAKSVLSVARTLKNLPKHKSIFTFLASMFFYANSINAAIVFLFLYGREQINLSVKAFFVVYAIQSVGAVIGSIFAGKAADYFSPKKVLYFAGFSWIAVILMLIFVNSLTMFIIAGSLGGAALGAVWTAQRPKLIELVKGKNVGQFFGFLELTNKFSGVIGPILFGALAAYVSYTAALSSLVVFFAIGLLILRGVPDHAHSG